MVDCLEDVRELNRENARPHMWIYESEIVLYWEFDQNYFPEVSYSDFRKRFIESMNGIWDLTIIF